MNYQPYKLLVVHYLHRTFVDIYKLDVYSQRRSRFVYGMKMIVRDDSFNASWHDQFKDIITVEVINVNFVVCNHL